MSVFVPILAVSADEEGNPPVGWCLPSWYAVVKSWDADYGKVFIKTACRMTEECEVQPEELRAKVERALQAMPVWGNRPLTMATYAVGRNIQSEFGDGTPMERAAIAFVALNRARAAGEDVVAHLLHHQKGTFGKQTGSVRPASTAQDPSVANLLLAELITTGLITDFTGGATHYFDRVSQDYMHRRNPDTPDGESVYLDWTAGGDFLTWQGLMPEIRPWRLALMRRRSDLRPAAGDTAAIKQEKIDVRAAIRAAGQKAVLGRLRPPTPWSSCVKASVELAKRTLFGDIEAELPVTKDREGMAVAGFMIGMSAIAGVAIAQIAKRREARPRPLGRARRRRPE